MHTFAPIPDPNALIRFRRISASLSAIDVQGAGDIMASHILVVDDDQDHLSFITELLTRAGYRVTSCPGGAALAKTLDAVGATPFDLMLTDLVMPDMDGLEVLRYVAQRYPGLPMVGMTGLATDWPVYSRAMEASGACEVFTKPIDVPALLTALARHLPAQSSAA